MSEFIVDKGVAVAAPARKPYKYPFNEMDIGDSFLARFALEKALRTSASLYGTRHGLKFSVRLMEDGVRVWRIAGIVLLLGGGIWT